MRDAFSNSIIRLAQADPSVVLLTGDHGYALFDEFRKTCPTQYINAGIAEQNMVGMAAGLARAGFRPIVYGLSAFIPVRVVEQIKLDIAHDKLPVILIGDGAGFVYSHLGTSHQSTEDIACTRAIPDLAIYSPADGHELNQCMDLAYQAKGPVYLRMGKADRGAIHSDSLTFKVGDLIKIHAPSPSPTLQLSMIATGSMAGVAKEIAATAYPKATVWTAPFIKPINEQQIIQICKSSSHIIVLEEHSTLGGLGSVITEISALHAPLRVLRIGVEDRFSHYCGSYEYLLTEHGLDRPSILKKIQDFLAS